MTVALTGLDLARDDLVRVARKGERVGLHPDALTRMAAARTIVDERLAAGDPIYDGSTAVGVLKRTGVPADDAGDYSAA